MRAYSQWYHCPCSEENRRLVQNFHFLRQAPVFFTQLFKFRRIRILPPLGLNGPKGFDLKSPNLQLSACDPKLLGNAALRRPLLIKQIIRVSPALLPYVILPSCAGE